MLELVDSTVHGRLLNVNEEIIRITGMFGADFEKYYSKKGECLYIAVNSAAVSKEIISLFTDKYRLLVIQSSLISIRIEPTNLSKEASFGKGPIFLLLRLKLFVNLFQKIGSPEFFPEFLWGRAIVHQSGLETVNGINRTRETSGIVLIGVIKQSCRVTQAFFQSLSDLLVIFTGNFSENGPDEVYMTHLLQGARELFSGSRLNPGMIVRDDEIHFGETSLIQVCKYPFPS